MALAYTTSPQLTSPSAAAGVSVTPNGSAWVNSAWVQITASTLVAWLLTGVNVVNGSPQQEFEIDIGTGTAGNEVVVATVAGAASTNDSVMYGYIALPIPIDNIAASTRVAVRIRQSGTNTTPWNISLTYFAKPVTGSVTSTPVKSQVVPAAANGVTVAEAGSAWNNSSWVEVTPATAGAWLLGAVETYGQDAEGEIDIGTGTAGNEIVVTTVKAKRNAATGAAVNVTPIWPVLNNIGSGVRVAVRVRSGATGGSWRIKLVYYESAGTLSAITTALPQVWAPSSAGSTTVTGGGSPWANGSWVQFIASTANIIAVTGLFIRSHDAAAEWEFDIGTGSVGNETVVGTVRSASAANPSDFGRNFLVFPVALQIPSGVRVAIRTRSAGASQASILAIGYINSPTFTQRSTEPPRTFPAAATGAAPTVSTTPWANSNWAELAATVGSSPILVTDLAVRNPDTADHEIDLGVGPPGSETVLTTLRVTLRGDCGACTIPLPVPTRVEADQRLAVRVRKSGTSGANRTFGVTYLFHTATISGLVLTVNDIEQDIRLGTLQISKVANGVDTFACEIMSEDGSYRPGVDDVVRLELDGEALFAGVITQPAERALTVPGEDPITTRITASDFNIYTTYAHVTETIPAGQTVKQILQVLEPYVTPFGASLDPAQIDGPAVAGLAWDDRPLNACLDDLITLAREAGADLCWELNYDLLLSAFDPTTRTAPFDITPTTSPDHVVGDLEIERSHADNYADKIIVKATPRAVSNYTESWTGDGYTTVFELTVTTTYAQTRGLVNNNGVDETLSEPGGGGTWEIDASVSPVTITKVSGPPPGAGDPITLVVFTGTYTGRATAGTGLIEAVVTLPTDVFLDAAGLQAFANAELAKRQVELVRGRYLSHTAGLEPGQTQEIEEPTHDVDSTFIVAEVNIRDLAPSADDFGQPPVLEYAATVIEGAVVRGDWREFWRAT